MKPRRIPDRAKSQSPLTGKLYNAAGEKMSPGYAVKNGVRYRYCISTSAMQSRPREATAVHRVPAEALEQAIVAAMNGREMSQLEGVVIHHASLAITITTNPDGEDSAREAFAVPWSKPSTTRRKEILQPADTTQSLRPMEVDERMRLLRGISAARHWLSGIIAGTTDLAAIATRENKSERAVRMTLSLAFLDPILIKAAISGSLPRGYGVTRMYDLPPLFDDQWRALGLARPQP